MFILEALKMIYPPNLPRIPKRPEEERRLPPPTPFPTPPEDLGKILRQILDRLDAIEKRLDKIEKILSQVKPTL